MTPTSEQLEAVSRFRAGGNLKINAFAGSGKTTTLNLIAGSTTRIGIYLAFNRSIANDAKGKFPKNVTCSTIHSLAFKATPRDFKRDNKMTGSTNVNAVAEMLGYNDRFFDKIKVTRRQQAHITKETLERFLNGGLSEISHRHLINYDQLGSLANLGEREKNELNTQAIAGARCLWARMIDPSDPLPLGHDGYLKLWALSDPDLLADFILLDEAQDANPVILGILSRQKSQIVYVGDRHQQIYEWRGAVNAMDIAQAENETYLTTSFRFGSRLASAASRVLVHLAEQRQIVGNPQIESFIGSDSHEAILARTNASVIGAVLNELEAGRRPYVIGGTSELIRMLRGVQDLRRGNPSDVSDFFGLANWNEAVEFSQEPAGAHLLTFVRLVERFGEDHLISKLHATSEDEKRSDVVISTSHKAKGREWDTVKLLDDFAPSRLDQVTKQWIIDPAEIRIFYVALTRARTAVELSPSLAARFGIRYGPPYISPSKPHSNEVEQPAATPSDGSLAPPLVAPQPAAHNASSKTEANGKSRRYIPILVISAIVIFIWLFSYR